MNTEGKPKILFIMHLPPPIHGAAQVGKWIQESELVNSTFDCYYINLTLASNLADIGKTGIGKLKKYLALLKRIRKTILEVKPDFVYITPNSSGGAFIKDCITVNMIRRMGVRVLAHFHNKGVSRYQHKWLYNKLYKSMFKDLKVLLIVPQLYDDMKKYVRIRDLYFCPNGVPAHLEFEPEAEREHAVPEILFLSNMIVSKGVIDLLDALYLLRGDGRKFHCTLIGGQTDELDTQKIQHEIESRHLNGYAIYIGPRYGNDRDFHFASADIMAFPTYYPKECFSLVNLEAMEWKLPVVTTNEGGLAYAVKDGVTGVICEKQNPIDLARALSVLLDDEELRWDMGERGYADFQKYFTVEKFMERFVHVLKRALKETPPQPKKLFY